MTTANKITILRILLVPFFVVELLYYVRTGHDLHRVLGLAAFGMASILDGVDGFVARHFNQRSELGTVLDPLADKLLLVSAIVLLSTDNAPRLGQIPLWLTVTIISRDLLLGLGVTTVRLVVGEVLLRPRITGKIATVFQMVTVCWLLLRWDSAFPALWLKMWVAGAGVFTGISGLLYVWDGTRQLSAHPSSGPVPK